MTIASKNAELTDTYHGNILVHKNILNFRETQIWKKYLVGDHDRPFPSNDVIIVKAINEILLVQYMRKTWLQSILFLQAVENRGNSLEWENSGTLRF